MDEVPHEAWFYSHEGERIGPITFADLQIKAKEGQLNPRLDLVWKHGMDQWEPSGQIEGLFERRTSPEPQRSLGPATTTTAPARMDPYPLDEESPEEQMGKQVGWLGARRRSYLFVTLIFPILWSMAFGAATGFLTKEFGPEIMNKVKMAAPIVPVIVLLYFGVKRLINLGMSGWWYLGNLVPLLNLWIGYRCFACPAGYAFHKKLDGIGIFLAIIYWLLVLVFFAAIAAAVAVYFNALGNPELQERVREIINQAIEHIEQARKK